MPHCIATKKSYAIKKCNVFERQDDKFTKKKSTSLDQKIRNRDQWHHFNMHNTNGKLAATSMKSFEASTFLSPFIFTRKKRQGKGVRHIPRVMHA
jgi:hypothetical protein